MYNFSLTSIVIYSGGSYQVLLSLNVGYIQKVLHLYISNCPLSPIQEFTLPSDILARSVLFAQLLFNKFGNREWYMNYAYVIINGVNGSTRDYLEQRLTILAANMGNGCGTVEGYDLIFLYLGSAISSTLGNTVGPIGYYSVEQYKALKRENNYKQ